MDTEVIVCYFLTSKYNDTESFMVGNIPESKTMHKKNDQYLNKLVSCASHDIGDRFKRAEREAKIKKQTKKLNQILLLLLLSVNYKSLLKRNNFLRQNLL